MGYPVMYIRLSRYAFAFMLCAAVLSSCHAYRKPAPTPVIPVAEEQKRTAYVTNAAAFSREYAVLRYANHYDLVADSTAADVAIRLEPLQIFSQPCVTPQFTVLSFTLGFYPVSFYETCEFSYVMIDGNEETPYTSRVMLEKRVSWFHLFIMRKSRRRALGRALAG